MKKAFEGYNSIKMKVDKIKQIIYKLSSSCETDFFVTDSKIF